ncbi:uncharacterized protein SPAPADRAFT_67764 [Spathaspora passalidarum NRRL Y-27907]|uniref:Uncharacterized protein n=1 Tax=Spathaspora passalidarum (strain NRRL Y-27907 / 11-Y1) TaxID=619300 RepID=G3ARD2_SPAPN|nr:uncharacterized protein SPAPADRAFT_67764 [Spathaspora passalidarum NRRL Y-27907]EGW31738.1 hypothetical protein SPAPADRAFT_67764 [Spathaspora passalidarum NRRL Y-27907]
MPIPLETIHVNQSKFIDKLILDDTDKDLTNTKQFDELLTHLESTLSQLLTPSVDIIRILFTLASRTNEDTSLRDRAVFILNKYIESDNEPLYSNLIEFIEDFAESQYVVKQTVKSPKKKINTTDGRTGDIMNMIETSPRKKQKQPIIGEVSDSEEESPILANTQDEIDSMREEVKMEHPEINNLSTFLNRVNGTVLKKEEIKSISHDKWDRIKVFGDVILSKRLHPKKNFTIWNLINWTFYCCGKSSNSYSNYHAIYTTHSNVLQLIFTLVEIDLVQKGDLLQRLITQLAHFKASWYDRLIEFVFNGLSHRDSPIPKSCYSYEKDLLQKSEPALTQNKQDNLHSLNLRFKIVNMVYYWSFLKNEDDSSSTSMSQLLKQLTQKLLTMDYNYLIEFYYSIHSESHIELMYRKSFLVTLSQYFLTEITGVPQFDFRLTSEQDENLQLVLKWMGTSNIYLSITEDETFVSFNSFLQTWLKFNFVLSWLFTQVVNDLDDKDSIEVDTIFDICEKADVLRTGVFEEKI